MAIQPQIPDDQTQPNFESLDTNVIRFEIIGGAIVTLIVSLALLIGILVLWFNIGNHWVFGVASGIAIAIVVGLVWLTLAWPSKSFRHTKWKLDEEGLEIHRGVIWRHRISIPIGRVQHADVTQGPLQRPFGLGKLTVHTAGTQNASVDLDGLAHDVALSLRDRLVKQAESLDVT